MACGTVPRAPHATPPSRPIYMAAVEGSKRRPAAIRSESNAHEVRPALPCIAAFRGIAEVLDRVPSQGRFQTVHVGYMTSTTTRSPHSTHLSKNPAETVHVEDMTPIDASIPATQNPHPLEVAECIQWRFIRNEEDNALLWQRESVEPSESDDVPRSLKWVDQVEAARIVAVTPRTLRNWRKQGRFAQGVETGYGTVRYAMPDLRRLMVVNQFTGVRHSAWSVMQREYHAEELHAVIRERLDHAGLWAPDAEILAYAYRLENPIGPNHAEELELYRMLSALPLEEGLV